MVISGTRSTSGDGTAVVAVAAASKIIVGPFIQLQNLGSATVTVLLKIGSTEKYHALLPENGIGVLVDNFPIDHGTGAAGEDLYVNLSASVDVKYQIEYRTVAV